MSELVCLSPKSAMEIECVCFDQKPCDIKIDDGGHLVCRYGSNEGFTDGIANVICPLEIASEQVKWDLFLSQEQNASAVANRTPEYT